MNRLKSRLLILSVILLWALSLSIPGWAAEYPSKPITFILPYPAGGSTDLTTRALANAAKKYLTDLGIAESRIQTVRQLWQRAAGGYGAR